MAVVTIMCPRTGKQVSTGLSMDHLAFTAMPFSRRFVSHCWFCGGKHPWSKRWAILMENRDPALVDASPISSG